MLLFPYIICKLISIFNRLHHGPCVVSLSVLNSAINIFIVTVVFSVSKCVCVYTPIVNMSLDESAMQNPLDNEETNNLLGYVPMLNRKVFELPT